MLSKNNFNEKLRQMDNQRDHFSIRKLTIGAASVLIGISFMGFGGQAVHADEVTNTQPAVEQVSKETTTDSTQQNNDAQKDVATAQKTEVATDSQANNQTDNTKESAQLVKPITEADVKATTESQKAEIADKTNEVKPSDTQVQEKQKEQTSDQTQSLVVDKKATENTQAATDIATEKVRKTVQLQAKIQARIAPRAKSESQFNVKDWDGSLDNTTHEYTLNTYHGNKENIYIPNTQDFIDAGRISSDDKVYITKDLMKSITINGAVNITVDDQGEKNKVYAKGDWNKAFSNGYRTYLKHVDLSHVDTNGVTNMNGLFYGNNDLQSVNFSGCDLSNVTDTSNMFAYADWNIKHVNLDNTKGVTREILDEYVNAAKHTNKTNLDLSGINLSPNVTSLHGLFANMSNLESVNLSGLDISHITDMGGMFSGDSNLESLDLSGLDLSKVTNTDMFDRVGGKIKSVNITNTKSIPRSILDVYLKALSNAGTTTIDLRGINLSPSITSFNNLFSNMPNLESVNLSGLDTSHITDMGGMFSNDTSLKSVNLSGLNLEKVKDLSKMFCSANNLENVDFSNTKFAPDPNTNSMFAWADGNIKSVNLKNAKNVTDYILRIYARAIKNSNATTADLSDINLSPNVTSLNGLLSNMPELKNVNLSGLDISHITDMGGMFSGDSNLESLDLSGLDLSKVTNTDNMFDRVGGKIKSVNITNTKSIPRSILDIYLKALSNAGTTTIDLSGINLSPNVTSLNGLFANMPNLKSVILSGLDISNITDMGSMFSGDNNLESLDLSGLDLSKVTNTNNMFAWADWNIKHVNLDNTKGVTREILDEYVNAAKHTNKTNLDLSHITLASNTTDLSNLFANMPKLTTIKGLETWDTSHVTNMSGMFYNDPKLTTIKGLENWHTENVTDMSNMFASYTNPTTNDYNPKSLILTGHLKSLDLSKWNTGRVTNMNSMFCGQTYLTSLGDLNQWNTSNVTDMGGLFYDLENIPALNLSNWTTDKVTDMSYMFSKMSKIKNLDTISNWNTHSVKDMSYMFNGMTNLERLDLSNWDPSSVGTNNTEQNYSLARMFSDDINLTTVGDLYKWADKTGNVHDTRWMFYNTPKLENVDLQGWNTGKLQIAEGMFWKSGAKHINLEGWDLSHLAKITDAGYVEGSPNPGKLWIWRGNEHMFQDLVHKSVISMIGIKLPNAKNAFTVMDFSGTNPIVVIANGQDGAPLNDLLAVNNQTWTDGAGNKVTGRQNSDFITYVRADDNTKQIGHHGLNFIFTNLNDLHNYFNKVTNRDAVKADMANDPNGKQLVHDWNAQHDVDGNNIVMTARRVSPDSSYDPYSMSIHDVDGKGNMLADLMTSKYQLHIVAPTITKETKDPTRTIIIENPDGSTSIEKQTVEFTRNVTKHIDGTEQATQWSPTKGTWDHFDVPQHDGYDSYIDGVAGTSIGAKNINADTNNVTIHVTYKSNTPDNPTPDNPEPEKPKPETPEVPNTPDEPEKPTVQNKDNDHNKSDKSENIRPQAEDKAKNKKNSKTHNAGAHGQAAPRAATAPNRLVAPKGDQLATGKGLKELSNKPASAAKANANNKETLPQTGEEKDNVGLLRLGLLALAALGFVDRKRRD